METINQEIDPEDYTDYLNSDDYDCSINEDTYYTNNYAIIILFNN
jgi:hypothetical protein